MFTFTNNFAGASLKQRIGMLNRPASCKVAWGRYGLWSVIVGVGLLACQYERQADKTNLHTYTEPLAPTNATRRLAHELDTDKNWHRVSAFPKQERTLILNGRRVKEIYFSTHPSLLCIRDNKLSFIYPKNQQTKVFINGRESSQKALEQLAFDNIAEIFDYHRQTALSLNAETQRILISTTHQRLPETADRRDVKQYLTAAALSQNPLGTSNTFSMNKLLEATFFQDKRAFVERTKDEHLKLLPEFEKDIELYINGLTATPAAIQTVHVREVDRLYTAERPYSQWLTDTPNRQRRYILYVQTAPKRAKRDSTYYVFSPFYSGDF